jgi:type IX secretion system PorP/SprF family membrane protein
MDIFNTINVKYWFLFLLLFPFFSNSQQESFLANYRLQMSLINPAYAGSEAENMIALTSRNQWVSLENSPKTQVMTFSSERGKNVGLGLSFIANNFFVERNTASYIDFSYKLNFTNETALYLGLKAGATFYKENLLGLTSSSLSIDPAQGLFSRVNPNLGIGMLIQSPVFWFSFSVPRLFNSGGNSEFSITSTDRVHTYFGSGVKLKVNDSFFLKPSILIRTVSDLSTTADFLALVSYKNTFDVGASYRTNNSLGLISYFSLKSFLDIGYAYETPLEIGLSGLSISTHEISLRFKFGSNPNTEETAPEE